MPEIVESKQYELFCNEQMIKSELRQMWANKKRRRICGVTVSGILWTTKVVLVAGGVVLDFFRDLECFECF